MYRVTVRPGRATRQSRALTTYSLFWPWTILAYISFHRSNRLRYVPKGGTETINYVFTSLFMARNKVHRYGQSSCHFHPHLMTRGPSEVYLMNLTSPFRRLHSNSNQVLIVKFDSTHTKSVPPNLVAEFRE